MNETTTSPGGFTLAAFTLAVTLGGANFLAVRFSNRELPPFWGAGLRFTVAAVLFVVLAVVLRLPWPRGRQLVLTGLYGLFSFAFSYALMYWALVRVTAGMATVVLAVVPLVTLLLAGAQRLERLRRRTLVGSLLALAGILSMTLGPRELVLPLSGVVAMLAASLTIGQSVVFSKRVSGNHPVITNAVGMTIGAPILLGLSALVGEQWALPRQPEAVWSLAYLVTLGSLGLFILTLLVVRRWTASAASYMFVLFPIVTLVLGAWLADEPLHARAVLGALIVISGVWFGALAPARRLPTPRSAAEAVASAAE
jgi:drug/metabolite transporter (DMT)-like permease